MLGALVDYYEYLLEHHPEKISPPGWGTTRITAFLEIDRNGDLVGVIPAEEDRGTPRRVPKQVERSSGVAANLLCDTSSYLLGIDAKGKPERAMKCFEAAKELHCEELDSAQGPFAQAVRSFFEKWDPARAEAHPVVQGNREFLLNGRNLAFALEGEEVLKNEDIERFVNEHAVDSNDAPLATCLISGEKKPIARLHPKIKGVPGAQSSGAVLVGFNAPSFTSYGHDNDQGLNAPIGEYEAFAYTTALNHLLADPAHHIRIGDTTIVYWALRDDDECARDFSITIAPGSSLQLFGSSEDDADSNERESSEDPDHMLDAIMESVRRGKKVGSAKVDAPFFVLGLSPNAARISVRFFLASTFGEMISNLDRHYERLQIARSPFDKRYLSPKRLVWETENPNAKRGTASDMLAGALMRAILTNGDYPTALYQRALMRMRATQNNEDRHTKKVDYGRAAIIRAFLIKNCGYDKEDLTVDLNTDRRSVPYALGRLFAVLERVQEEAARVDGRTLNSTIVDRYFNSACATPGIVFPVIEKLSIAHLAKLRKNGRSGYFSKLIGKLNEIIDEEEIHLPKRLTIEEQGDFITGYWCQRQAFFNSKEEQTEAN